MRFEHLGFAPDFVDYEAAWDHQREVHAAVVEGAEDTVLLLEHAAVYTAGKRTEPHERPFDGTPVIDVDRGGQDHLARPRTARRLPDRAAAGVPIDVVAHVRRLEEVMIRVCASSVSRPPGSTAAAASGCWPTTAAPDRKLGAIGVRVSRQVHHARLRPQLRRRPVVGRQHRRRAASPTPASARSAARPGALVTVQDVLPYAEKHLADVLTLA